MYFLSIVIVLSTNVPYFLSGFLLKRHKVRSLAELQLKKISQIRYSETKYAYTISTLAQL